MYGLSCFLNSLPLLVTARIAAAVVPIALYMNSSPLRMKEEGGVSEEGKKTHSSSPFRIQTQFVCIFFSVFLLFGFIFSFTFVRVRLITYLVILNVQHSDFFSFD